MSRTCWSLRILELTQNVRAQDDKIQTLIKRIEELEKVVSPQLNGQVMDAIMYNAAYTKGSVDGERHVSFDPITDAKQPLPSCSNNPYQDQ